MVRPHRSPSRIHVLLAALFTISSAGCSTPPRPTLPPTYALAAPEAGPLIDLEARCTEGADLSASALTLLSESEDALRWRLALVDSAVRSIDVQTYIWQSDEVGLLLVQRLLAAADRGVRVRLLVDDFRAAPNDQGIAEIAQHPSVEIRIFNPWSRRSVGRGLEFLARMSELNSRMHNKVIVADDVAAISGGRNIGNEYFGLSDRFNFDDLDVLAIGPVARELSDAFDYYWNSNWVVHPPATANASAAELATFSEALWTRLEANERLHAFRVRPHAWAEEFESLLPRLVLAPCDVVYDRLIESEVSLETAYGLRDFFAAATRELLISNAYLVPSEPFYNAVEALTSEGVRVALLTNSLGSTDAAIVNSAYQRTRVPLLRSGAELYELRHDAEDAATINTAPVTAEFVGLHTKAAVVDRRKVFIGSFNLSPRSFSFNTEMGLFIDSPELGERIARLIERRMNESNAWTVELNDGSLQWRSGETIHQRQPARSFYQRFENGFFSILPVRDQV
jgi:putative cardiolipin synthase